METWVGHVCQLTTAQPRVGHTAICVVCPGNLTRGPVCLPFADPFKDGRTLPEKSGPALEIGAPEDEDASLAAETRLGSALLFSQRTYPHARLEPRALDVP